MAGGFLDIRTAARVTGLSEKTIRRRLKDAGEDAVRREGRKLLVDVALLGAGQEDNKSHTKPKPKPTRRTSSPAFLDLLAGQLQEKDRLIRSLQDTNDRLLDDLKVKDNDVKAAWSLIRSLQDENKLLTADVKVLKEADGGGRMFTVLSVILTVAVVFLVIYLVAA